MKSRLVHCIDTPAAGALLDPLALQLEGWIAATGAHPAVVRLEVQINGRTVAATRTFSWRRDVNQVLGLAADARSGFAMLGHLADLPAPAAGELEFHAHLIDGSSTIFGRVPVSFIATDYRQKPYGVLLQPHATQFRRRDEIYRSDRSQNVPSADTFELLRQHIGPPPVRVLDVGCGLASHGRQLLNEGYGWVGVGIDAHDGAELARLGLPIHQVDGGALPFADNAFEIALCVEVLEHVTEPRAFLPEIKRVAPRLLVSVPNIELLAYLSPYEAVPWHMLEGDHKNFFTRWSLRGLLGEFFAHVEVVGYSPAPLPTVDGTRLDYHLLAIAQE